MLELSQGNTYSLVYNIVNTDNSIKDLSGTLELKYQLSSRKTITPVISFTLADTELNITDAVNGQITITLENTVLNTLNEGSYYHEVWHTDALSVPSTLVDDKVLIYTKLIKE